MVECTLFMTHCLRHNLQLYTISLVRTCRISSFCTAAWQLARLLLTRRIARSLGDSWASCTFLVPAHPGNPGQRAVKRVCVCSSGPIERLAAKRLRMTYFVSHDKVAAGAWCKTGQRNHMCQSLTEVASIVSDVVSASSANAFKGQIGQV